MTESEIYESAQMSVIGALLIDPERCIGDVMQAVAPDDFTGELRTVFEAIRGVWASGKRVDTVVALEALGDGYRDLLRQCMRETPTVANVLTHCEVVRSQSALQTLRGIGVRLTGAADAAEAREILSEAQTLMAERQGLRGRPVAQLLADFLSWVSSPAPAEYLPWGIRQLDELMAAERGDFIVLGADSSVGKTALAVQLAWAQAAKGRRVGFFSLETSGLKLTRRLVAQRARIPMDAIKGKRLSDEQVKDVVALGSASNRVPLMIYDAAGVSVDELRAAVTADRLEVIYVDYVQLLSAPGRERWEIVTAISMALHTMAQQLGVAVVGLSQITATDKKSKSGPGKDDLRESKQLKQDADLIMMMSLDNPEDYTSLRWLSIEKNKDGPLGSVCLKFDPKYMDFTPTDSRAFSNRPRSSTASSPKKFTDEPDPTPPPEPKPEPPAQGSMFTDLPDEEEWPQ